MTMRLVKVSHGGTPNDWYRLGPVGLRNSQSGEIANMPGNQASRKNNDGVDTFGRVIRGVSSSHGMSVEFGSIVKARSHSAEGELDSLPHPNAGARDRDPSAVASRNRAFPRVRNGVRKGICGCNPRGYQSKSSIGSLASFATLMLNTHRIVNACAAHSPFRNAPVAPVPRPY